MPQMITSTHLKHVSFSALEQTCSTDDDMFNLPDSPPISPRISRQPSPLNHHQTTPSHDDILPLPDSPLSPLDDILALPDSPILTDDDILPLPDSPPFFPRFSESNPPSPIDVDIWSLPDSPSQACNPIPQDPVANARIPMPHPSRPSQDLGAVLGMVADRNALLAAIFGRHVRAANIRIKIDIVSRHLAEVESQIQAVTASQLLPEAEQSD